MPRSDHQNAKTLGAYLQLIAAGELPDQIPADISCAEELGAVCSMVRACREETEQLKVKLARETAYARVLANSKLLYKDIFTKSITGILIVSEQGKILDANNAVESMLGYSINELTRYNLSDISLPDEHASDAELIGDLVEGRRTYFNVEKRYVRSDSTLLWVLLTVFAVTSDFDTPLIITMLEDISARKSAELHLQHVSTHDSLTGLYNRTYFDSEFNRLQNGMLVPVSIVIVDVDGLKAINDSKGHEAGDQLIVAVARVLSEALGSDGILARIGGDEFALLLPQTDQAAADEVVGRIRSYQQRFNQAMPKYPVHFSVGVATASRGSDIPETFKQADAQMYADKMMRKAGAQTGQHEAVDEKYP